MLTMKSDMGSAALLAGALWGFIQQGLSKRVKLYLCCAENLVSDKNAFKLGDILHYKNRAECQGGLNTDAEGRLVLTMGYWRLAKPARIMNARPL